MRRRREEDVRADGEDAGDGRIGQRRAVRESRAGVL